MDTSNINVAPVTITDCFISIIQVAPMDDLVIKAKNNQFNSFARAIEVERKRFEAMPAGGTPWGNQVTDFDEGFSLWLREYLQAQWRAVMATGEYVITETAEETTKKYIRDFVRWAKMGCTFDASDFKSKGDFTKWASALKKKEEEAEAAKALGFVDPKAMQQAANAQQGITSDGDGDNLLGLIRDPDLRSLVESYVMHVADMEDKPERMLEDGSKEDGKATAMRLVPRHINVLDKVTGSDWGKQAAKAAKAAAKETVPDKAA